METRIISNVPPVGTREWLKEYLKDAYLLIKDSDHKTPQIYLVKDGYQPRWIAGVSYGGVEEKSLHRKHVSGISYVYCHNTSLLGDPRPGLFYNQLTPQCEKEVGAFIENAIDVLSKWYMSHDTDN